MRVALINGRVMVESGAVEQRAVVIENGRIAAVPRAADLPNGIDRHDLRGALVLPGFVDSQVNGGGGVLFGDSPDIETLRIIAAAHARYGTTAFLPTLISGDLSTIARAIAAVEDAIAQGVPGVIGIHIEGPFLNPERRGIHDAANFRVLDTESTDLLMSARRGKTLVTLAPEQTTPDAIRALTKAGVIVSAGHTDATYRQTHAALAAGLTGFTHLFNAMSPLRAREPGVVGAALDHSESWCGIIADGRHVDPATLRVALACKGSRRLMLVTDAMPSVGAPIKSFTLQGRRITVQGGVCIAPDGTLAGCDLDMASAVRNAMQLLGVTLAEAVAMASATPAAFLGLDNEMGTIQAGRRANIAAVDDDLTVQDVWIDGRRQRID